MEKKIKDIIVEQLGANPDQVIPSALLEKDLGADELDMVELCMYLEEAFGIEIPDEDWDKVKTVKDVIEYINTKKRVKDGERDK